jgi:dienelactone hydrolase
LPPGSLRDSALGAYPSRFLESGYVVLVVTYRRRDQDLQSQTPASLADVSGAVELARGLPFVDSSSVVANGCSGGGDLALRLAATTDLAAAVAEEPVSIFLADPTADDIAGAGIDGERVDWVEWYRTEGDGAAFRDKIARIGSPVLIVQGDERSQLNRFNAEVLVPELKAMEQDFDVATYPGGHCFAFAGQAPSAPGAFQRIDAFLKERLAAQPAPMDSALVDHVPVTQPPAKEEIDVAADVLANYVGSYRLPMGLPDFPPDVAPTMVVTLEDGRLLVEVKEGTAGKVPFFAESETFFFSPQYGWTMEFVEDEDGAVIDLLWNGGLWASRL